MEKKEQLIRQISHSENELKKAEQAIERLKSEKKIIMLQKGNPNFIKEENEQLKMTHQFYLSYFKGYQNQVLDLQKQLQNNQAKLIKIKEENENLKRSISKVKNNNNITNNNYRIKNIKDLKKTIKFDTYKNDNQNHNNIINVKEIKKYTIDAAKKKEFENLLKNLKLKSNEYIFKINEQNQKIKEYRDYLQNI